MNLQTLMLSAAACLLSAPLVLAQTAPAPQAAPPAADATQVQTTRGGGPLSACRADAETLCAGIERGRGARLDCLAQNKDKVSAACRTAMDGLLARHASGDGERRDGHGRGDRAGRGAMAACAVDVATHCAGSEGDRGKRRQCLVENASKLSAECTAALEEMRGRGQQMREACAADRQTLCADAERGPQTMSCLKENEAKLSATCSQALAQMPGRGRAQ